MWTKRESAIDVDESRRRRVRIEARRHCVLRWLLGITCAVSLVGGGDRLNAQESARGLVIPIFVPPEPHAAAVLRIQTITRGFRRQGFFRIGLLPQVVVEGVALELRSPDNLAGLLQTIRTVRLSHPGEKALVIRNVQIRATNPDHQLLAAKGVSGFAENLWRLQDGSVHPPGGPAVSFQKAMLHLAGTNAGHVVIEEDGKLLRMNLLRPRTDSRN